MGANMFAGPFSEARVWAFEKPAMYAGLPAGYISHSTGGDDTPQPLNLHGWNAGSWPSSGPHYILTSRNFNGQTFQLYSWDDPFGADTFTSLTTLNVQAAHGVSSGYPVDNVQQGGPTITGSDYRPQDFEYRNGSGWMAGTVSCNPGSGTVNCIQFARTDLASQSVAEAGVYAGNGEYRYFGDLAANICGEALVGYTKSSSSLYPGVYAAGPAIGGAGIQTPPESTIHAGTASYYTWANRWGDYSGMTIDPDGLTFWYLGEFSRTISNGATNWSTWIGSLTTASCGGGDLPPSVNIVNPADGSVVSGGVTIQIDATDNEDPTGSLTVEWKVDGGAWQAASYNGATGYYEDAWDTTTVGDGSHTINTRASDSFPHSSTAANNVTVDNLPLPHDERQRPGRLPQRRQPWPLERPCRHLCRRQYAKPGSERHRLRQLEQRNNRLRQLRHRHQRRLHDH